MPRNKWTPQALATLKAMWPDTRAREIMATLGISEGPVYRKARELGLQRSPEFVARVQAATLHHIRTHPAMLAQQKGKGQAPWNKGMPGSTGTHDGCRPTQFKPGNRPHTWVPVGTQMVRYHKGSDMHQLTQKVSDQSGPAVNRWRAVTELVWIAAHGPIPAGHIVVFAHLGLRTTVAADITPDKLICITRAEHARRNHPRNKHPELGRLVQLKGAINRQVNRINREAQERAAQTGATP